MNGDYIKKKGVPNVHNITQSTPSKHKRAD